MQSARVGAILCHRGLEYPGIAKNLQCGLWFLKIMNSLNINARSISRETNYISDGSFTNAEVVLNSKPLQAPDYASPMMLAVRYVVLDACPETMNRSGNPNHQKGVLCTCVEPFIAILRKCCRRKQRTTHLNMPSILLRSSETEFEHAVLLLEKTKYHQQRQPICMQMAALGTRCG